MLWLFKQNNSCKFFCEPSRDSRLLLQKEMSINILRHQKISLQNSQGFTIGSQNSMKPISFHLKINTIKLWNKRDLKRKKSRDLWKKMLANNKSNRQHNK